MKPLQKTFSEVKETYPDALILFRCGDYYESLFEDAFTLAECLGVTIAKNGDGWDIAGFRHNLLDDCLAKLVRAGHRVAIIDQVVEPKKLFS